MRLHRTMENKQAANRLFEAKLVTNYEKQTLTNTHSN